MHVLIYSTGIRVTHNRCGIATRDVLWWPEPLLPFTVPLKCMQSSFVVCSSMLVSVFDLPGSCDPVKCDGTMASPISTRVCIIAIHDIVQTICPFYRTMALSQPLALSRSTNSRLVDEDVGLLTKKKE